MLTKIESFFSGNKVLVLGALSALSVVLQQALSSTIDWKVIGFAALIAVLSYLAKNLSGTVASVLGILGGVATTISQVAVGGSISWNTLILSTVVAVIGVVTSTATSTKTTATPS